MRRAGKFESGKLVTYGKCKLARHGFGIWCDDAATDDAIGVICKKFDEAVLRVENLAGWDIF